MIEFNPKDIALFEMVEGVFTEVRVLQVKQAYGKVRYVVTPVKGIGQATVEKLHKLTK